MSSALSGGYRHMVWAVLRREVILFVRYPINAVGTLVTHFAFFSMLFIGGRMLAGRAMSDSIEGIIVGYLLWMMAATCYQGISGDIQSDASWGTLERHLMTPFGFGSVLLVKSLAKLVFNFGYASVLLVAMMAVTGRILHVDVVTIVPITALALTAVFGLGFALGGLTILYKNITAWMSLFQFGLIGLVAAPTFEQEWLLLLPLAQGSEMLQRAMRDGIRLWEFDTRSLLILLVTAIVYLTLGYAVFIVCQDRARKLGTIGHY